MIFVASFRVGKNVVHKKISQGRLPLADGKSDNLRLSLSGPAAGFSLWFGKVAFPAHFPFDNFSQGDICGA